MSLQTKDEKQSRDWHTLEASTALEHWGVSFHEGLTTEQVVERQAEYGSNELVETGLKNPWQILSEQFAEAMVLVLIAAAVVSAVIDDIKGAIAILAIVVLNAVLGFVQEYRAERAMAALKQLAAPHVKVRRDGQVQDIESHALVPGDIILLEPGDAVPADGRVIESVNLQVQEASLTGESVPVEKYVKPLSGTAIPVADRHNMVFMSTSVTYGRAVGVVTETGMNTELGRIAELIQTVETEQTPLQKRMARLGRSLAIAALAIVVVVFVLGLLRGGAVVDMFLTAVALAVAAVPEGLPAVVTIALALGAQRMLRRNALIRKLPAVETLGSVTVICSDKTGTLTENRMAVKIVDVAEHTIDLDQVLRDGMPVFHSLDEREVSSRPAQALMMSGSALCNDAVLREDENVPGDYWTVGDPTEGALLVAAARYGFWKPTLETFFPRVAEAPFTSERKRMTTVHENKLQLQNGDIDSNLVDAFNEFESPLIAFTKGAVDGLVEISDRVWVEGKIQPISDAWRTRIEDANDLLAQDGLRVLGVGFQAVSALPEGNQVESLEEGLVFVGMVGMMDPPRPEVKDAVLMSKTAGIRPVMITGDHPLTAQRIAQDLHITSNGAVLTGQDLTRMSAQELENVVEDVSVFARVSPEHKLHIVQALQRRGHIVAMTGDGVNDAPALRRSDIGIAMGITGTDVSKEASDMVILDDNFATIVKAIREGRTIYDNVRKFIQYTLTSNIGEIIVMLLAPFLGMPLPLSALQILWINLVTDGLPGLALTLEPSERDTMQRPPYAPTESVFSRGVGRDMVWIGVLMGLVSLGLGFWGWNNQLANWRTMLFMTLTLSQMGNALGFRSNRDSLFEIGLISNKPMLAAVLLTFVLQLVITYWGPAQPIFGTQALTLRELGLSLLVSTIPFGAIEVEKWFKRRRT